MNTSPQDRWVEKLGRQFVVNVEIVPPAGEKSDIGSRACSHLMGLPVDGLNIADSPMARARMTPLLVAHLVEQECPGRFAYVPHLNARDHNRVAARGMLWGAAAMGVRAVLIVSGDAISFSNDPQSRAVTDVQVPDLIGMAREAGLLAGVVLDPRPAQWETERRKMARKVEAGAGFVITQPLFEPVHLARVAGQMEPFHLPLIAGILPLVSVRHARFLDQRVPGISVPAPLIAELERAGPEALAVGLGNARQMLECARRACAGACIMPPFERFDLVPAILS
ncbi:MAG: methylenetetrahydrofolate reductase [Anaerolineae bacterium]|nr:methylenetetrahydrofolate reductase [Anaerolineae bacterium]